MPISSTFDTFSAFSATHSYARDASSTKATFTPLLLRQLLGPRAAISVEEGRKSACKNMPFCCTIFVGQYERYVYVYRPRTALRHRTSRHSRHFI